MLFKRLRKQERKIHRLEPKLNWKTVGIPAVSALVLFATKGIQAEDFEFSNVIETIEERILAISVTPSSVDPYAPRGTVVGTISGDAGETAPYSLVSSGDAQDDDNGLFTIINNDQLVVNGDIWSKGKSTLSIYVQGMTGSPFQISIAVSNTINQGGRYTGPPATVGGSDAHKAAVVGLIDDNSDLDVAVIRNGNIDIFYGNGSGGFSSTYTISYANVYDQMGEDIAIGDIDGDGDMDLITGGTDGPGGQTRHFAFTNNGPGSWSRSDVDLSIYSTIQQVELADVDDDGDVDFIYDDGSSIGIKLNDGSGAFDTYGTSAVSSYGPFDLGDVDGDGDLDLLQGSPNSANVFYYSSGSGWNTSQNLMSGTGIGSEDVAFVDYDNDGDLDAFVATSNSSYGGLFINNAGTFVPVTQESQFTTGTNYGISTGDVDGDGEIDLLLADGSNYFSVIPSFNTANTWVNALGTSGVTEDIILADFDGDNDLDYFFVNNGAANQILLGEPNIPVSDITLSNESVDYHDPVGYKVADINVTESDGDNITLSLISSGSGDTHNGAFVVNGTSLYLNKEASAFGTTNLEINIQAIDEFNSAFDKTFNISVSNTPSNAHLPEFNASSFDFGFPSKTARVADFDNDTNLDIAQMDTLRVIIWYGDGTGDFPDSASYVFAPTNNPTDIEIGDVDNDGDIDMIVTGPIFQNPVFINQYSVGTPRAGFDNSTPVPDLYNKDFNDMSLGDLDFDGDVDMVAITGSEAYVFHNNGSGVFTQYVNDGLTEYNSLESIDLGDLDQDGDLDLFYAKYQPYVLWGNSAVGNFSGDTFISSGNSADIAVADIDGDGDLDGLMARSYRPSVIINDGGGSFTPLNQLNSGDHYEVVTGDIDADGDVDALLLSYDGSTMQTQFEMALNAGGYFNKSLKIGLPDEIKDIALGDFDKDGDLDIFASNYGGVAYSQLLINDINEPITAINFDQPSIDAYLAKGEIAGRFSVVDPDPAGGTLTFKIAGDLHAGAFYISDDSLIVNDDLYKLRDTNGDPNIVIQITAEDGKGDVFTDDITIPMTIPSGGGFFTDPSITVGSALNSATAAVGYIDNDANLDVAVINPGNFTIYYGNGDGTFPTNTPVTATGVGNDIELADIDKDGDLDVITAGGFSTGEYPVWRNDGGGTWTEMTAPALASFQEIEMGDVDDDGDLDLIASTGADIQIWQNDGSGLFNSSHGADGVGQGGSIDLGDVDGDGDLDLLLGTFNGGYVYYGTPEDGNFSNSSNNFINGDGIDTRDAELLDIDGDGDLDAFLATASATPYGGMFLNDGGFGQVPDGFTGQVYNVVPGDIDGDGVIDALMDHGSYYAANEHVFLPSFTTGMPWGSSVLGTTGVTNDIVLGDFDNDNDLDFFIVNNGANEVFLGNSMPVESVNAGLTLFEGNTELIDNTLLQFTDADNSSTEIAFTVTASPVNGQLENTGNPGVAITAFTQDDIDNSLIVYVHDGSATTADSFDFDVTDGINTAVSGTFSITVDPKPVLSFGLPPDITAATYSGTSLSVSGEVPTPSGMSFNNDGTKLYVVGFGATEVHEYFLSTPYDISTASPSDSFTISVQESGPTGVAFNSDGTKMFIVGTSDNVHEYTLGIGFDLTSAVYEQSFDLSGQESNPRDVAFSSDGSKMFVLGFDTQDAVYEYALGTPYDVGTATFTISFDFSAEETSALGLTFSLDGSRMYIVGINNDNVNEYNLSTPFDVSTASFTASFSVTSEETSPSTLVFSKDGKKMFIAGFDFTSVFAYDISAGTAFAEAPVNDGTVDGAIILTLSGDTFTNPGGVLTTPAEFTVDNLPAGFSPVVNVSDDGSFAILSLTGNATAHGDTDDLNDLQFTFTDAAFTGTEAINVVNAIGASSNLGIDFLENDAPVATVDALSTNDPTPPLTGTIDDITAALNVNIDGSDYAATVNADNTWDIADDVINSLADGSYDVTLTATDTIANVSVGTTTDAVFIDATAPVVSTDVVSTNDNTPALSGTIDDTGASITANINDSTYTATNNADGTWGLADNVIVALPDGFYSVALAATDSLGNVEQDTTANAVFIDATAPVVSTDEISTNDNTPPLSGTIDDTDAAITVDIDGNNYIATNNADGTWGLADDMIAALADGFYDVTATATDSLGNIEVNTATDAVFIDATAPVITVDPLTTPDTSPELTGTVDDETASITVNVDGADYSNVTISGTTWTLASGEIDPLSLGTYEVQATATDSLGNAGVDGTTNELTILVDPGRALDSAALVQIYEATGGPEWTDSGNWLTGTLETWNGITMTGDRVTSVDLSSNNLAGTFPAITSGLDAMVSFDVSDNELTEITDGSNFDALTTLDISLNKLPFTTLDFFYELSIDVTYDPQKEILEPERVLLQIGETHTVNREVPGGENYTWFANGSQITETASSFDVTVTGFEDEAVYHAEVTSSTVPGLTLTTSVVDVRVSSLERDEASLRLVYEAVVTNESGVSDWLNTSVNDWPEVTVTANRVTGVNLPNQSLAGVLPDDILDVAGLTNVNLSSNMLTLIPDVSSLESLTSFNVSNNNLDFASIEPNFNNAAVDFSNQALLGEAIAVNVSKGDNHTVSLETGGSSIEYQWKFRADSLGNEGSFIDVAGATDASYTISDIAYETMGDYKVEVTSSAAPEVTLESHIQEVLAVGNIEFFPAFEFSDGSQGFVDQGRSRLFKIKEGPFDTTETVDIDNERIFFEEVVLGNYLLNVRTEPTYSIIKDLGGGEADTVQFIPTYFTSEIDWVEADTLRLRDFLSDTLSMQRIPIPPDDGEGEIALTLESDFPDEESGRIESRRRVKKAGCSLRRRTTGGGGRPAEDEFVLIAYKETDDNGEVNFGLLPDGFYRLNIQYPGVPMDPNSFVEFEINADGGLGGYELAATVTTDGIIVEQVLGFTTDYFKDLNVYPVPADDQISITYKRLRAHDIRVRLANLNGQTLHQQLLPKGSDQNLKLDVSNIKGGIYLLYFQDEKQKNIAVYKIVVKH